MSPAFSRKGSGCCHDLLDVFVPVGGGGDLLVLSPEFGGLEEDCDEPPQGNDPILIRRPDSHPVGDTTHFGQLCSIENGSGFPKPFLVILDEVFSLSEEGLHVAVQEVAGDAFGDDGFVGFEGVEVAVSHLGGDLEADVEELADVRVVARVGLVVREGADVLFAGPGLDFFGCWELGVVDVDDGGVGLAEGFFFLEGLGVDFFGKVEGVSAGGGEADDFFEPVGAGGFDVEAGSGAGDRFFDGLVDREFVGAGMDGEFKSLGEAVGFDGVGEDGEVVVELLFELGDIADVVDSFIESTGELWRDGLDGDPLVGDGGENDEHLSGDLGVVGFVHRDFGHEVIGAAFCGDDVVVNRAGLLGGFEELVGGFFDELF